MATDPSTKPCPERESQGPRTSLKQNCGGNLSRAASYLYDELEIENCAQPAGDPPLSPLQIHFFPPLNRPLSHCCLFGRKSRVSGLNWGRGGPRRPPSHDDFIVHSFFLFPLGFPQPPNRLVRRNRIAGPCLNGCIEGHAGSSRVD